MDHGGRQVNRILTRCIAMIWIGNGLLCKVLNLVPRHQQIVGSILGEGHSRLITFLIGISEVLLAIWILTCYKSRLSAVFQIAVVATMNIIEFLVVPELLLWGKFNLLFSFLFIIVVYINEFLLKKYSVA